jgi:hypothetical protein
MQWFGARLQLLMAALMVLLATAASERSPYFCKMMGRAVIECCCDATHHAREQGGPAARAPDCCEAIRGSGQSVAAIDHATAPDLPAAALIATLPSSDYPEQTFSLASGISSFARAPPAIGPPLFLSHCALLL